MTDFEDSQKINNSPKTSNNNLREIIEWLKLGDIVCLHTSSKFDYYFGGHNNDSTVDDDDENNKTAAKENIKTTTGRRSEDIKEGDDKESDDKESDDKQSENKKAENTKESDDAKKSDDTKESVDKKNIDKKDIDKEHNPRLIYVDVSLMPSLMDEGEWPWYITNYTSAKLCSDKLKDHLISKVNSTYCFKIRY